MDSLRWILLGLGAVVIAGVYLWTRWQAAREERQYGAVESRGFDSEPVISEEPAVGHFAGPAAHRDVADDASGCHSRRRLQAAGILHETSGSGVQP